MRQSIIGDDLLKAGSAQLAKDEELAMKAEIGPTKADRSKAHGCQRLGAAEGRKLIDNLLA